MTRSEWWKRKRRESLRKRRPALARLVWSRDRGRCVFCLKVAKHIDHLRPKKHGGQEVLRNLALACAGCNTKKQARNWRWVLTAIARECAFL